MITPILAGPTATGKSSLAIEIAESAGDVEIINADSLLVYRGMDIGTAKPTAEERARVPHHLIDIREPNEPFTAGDFVREVEQALKTIHARGRRAMLVGGTGFYLKALLLGLWDSPPSEPELRAELEQLENQELYRELFEVDEVSALRIGGNDRYRLIRAVEILRLSGSTPSELEAKQNREPDPRFRLFVIDREDAELSRRIEQRTDAMLTAGLIDETRELLENYPQARALKAVGYRQVVAYLNGETPPGRKLLPGIEGLRSEILLATRQLVKSQRTWFRGARGALHIALPQDQTRLRSIFG